MKEIPLSRGKVALVDDEDFDLVSQHKWFAIPAHNTWYAQARIRVNGKRKSVQMHRFILNAPKGVKVDHKNHDGLDNRRPNLRFASPSQNAQNTRKVRTKTTSIYKGVYWDRWHKKWRVGITLGGNRKLVAYYDDELAAAATYDREARKLFGEYAHTNFEDEVPRGICE